MFLRPMNSSPGPRTLWTAWPDAPRRERAGTNKRYAEAIDARMNQRVEDVVMRDHRPANLKSVELELEKYALTIPPQPVPVLAWVRYGEVPIRVEAEAVRWTEKVVAIVWQIPGGEHRAWVWASAVDRR